MRLLRRYVELGSQEAFADLVRKHLPWVYSSCRRALRDPHLAEDAAQAVFIVLARRAHNISPETRLAGWLFNTARFVVKDSKKARSRYLRREEIARQVAAERVGNGRNGRHNGNGNGHGYANGNGNGHYHATLDASQQALLDDGLAALSERDRQALIMHFYEGLTLQQMAEALEIGKEGAKKRVGRALSRLRQKLGAKGILRGKSGKGRTGVSIIAVALLLRAQSAWALPAGLARRTIESVAAGGVGIGTGVGIGAGMAGWLADWTVGASARASWRLMRAVLAAQLLAAATVTMVVLWPSPASRRISSKPPARPPSAAVSAGAQAMGGTWQSGAVPSPSMHSEGPSQQPSFVTITTNDVPYRSGAEQPEPQAVSPPPKPVPTAAPAKKGTEVAAKAGAEGSGEEGAPVAGSTYAGLPPVARAASAEAVYEPPTPGPVKLDGMPQPPAPFGAVGGAGERAPKRAKEKEVAVTLPRPGAGTGTGSGHTTGTGSETGVATPALGPDGQTSLTDPVATSGTQVAPTGTAPPPVNGVDPAVIINSNSMTSQTSAAVAAVAMSSIPGMPVDPCDVYRGAGIARGPDFAGNPDSASHEPMPAQESGKVRRGARSADELADGLADGRRGRKSPRGVGGVNPTQWEKKSRQRAASRSWFDGDDDGHGEPLTIIGGRPIPIDVLPRHPVRQPLPGDDRPSFVTPGGPPHDWSGVGGAMWGGGSFEQVPEPSGLVAAAVGLGVVLMRRKRDGAKR
jgi:RNA polymerase sigma factor (sigma-70 family)